MALPNIEPLRAYLKQEMDGQGPPLDEYDPDVILATILEYLYASKQVLSGDGLIALSYRDAPALIAANAPTHNID
jgi:hypothetical protein